MPTSFDSIFFAVAGPSLLCYCLRSPVLTAPVRGSTPTLCCPVANCSRPGPVVNCLPAPLSSQLSFASPYHFRIRRDFRSKNPLSGFAPKQTKESSALAGHPYSATCIIISDKVLEILFWTSIECRDIFALPLLTSPRWCRVVVTVPIPGQIDRF